MGGRRIKGDEDKRLGVLDTGRLGVDGGVEARGRGGIVATREGTTTEEPKKRHFGSTI